VVCDIDHTLTTQGSAAVMAQALGVPAAHTAIYRAHRAGQLDHARTRTQLLALWQNTNHATCQTFTERDRSGRTLDRLDHHTG
jgi:phosphoserine phosphatase